MNIQVRNFLKENNIKPADAIVAKKVGYRILDHFIIYIGLERGKHQFMANSMDRGVRYYSEDEVPELIEKFEPVEIRPFKGSSTQRKDAITRAKNQFGKNYSLVNDNCEHFANYVQYGKKESPQVRNWVGAGIGLLALAIGVFSGNSNKR